MRAVWRTLRSHRDLRLLLTAGLVSLTGDWILRIGLTYHIYAVTGSTLASAMMLLASFAPQVLLSSVAGVYVDRWDRKRTMIGANLLLCVGLLPLLFVQTADKVWVVYLVLMWSGTVQLFFAPAEQAFIPHLVPDDRLVTANALNGQNRDLSRLIGSALGGVLAATGSITALTIVDAATFLVSVALIVRMDSSGRAEAPGGAKAPVGAFDRGEISGRTAAPGRTAEASEVVLGRVAAVRKEWIDGLRVALNQRVLRLLLAFALITSIGEGVMGTLFAPFVRDVLHGGGQAFGLIVSVQAIGGIIGGLVAAALSDRLSAAGLFGWGAVAFGFVDLAMFLYPLVWVEIWPAVVCMVVVGVPGAFITAGFMTLFQRNTTDAYRGRVFGAIVFVEAVAAIIGTLSAGFLGETVGIVEILAFQGAGYVVAGFAVLIGLRDPRTTTVLRGQAVSETPRG
jgi:Na+/melibiose symporter-like transporter